ncbi:hypothetical protein Tco_1436868 [Tanacetum coccineum]
MSDQKFADTHNLVAFLEKPTESEGFEEIIDFLNANPIKYALTVNPTVIITESIIRRDLQLEDVEGTECLPTATIFEELTRMGYEKLTQKLTFYKAFFSLQWKFLIHKILQCLCAKTTAWNEFSSTMASAIICLATNQKFNFSKYIFDSMVKNVDSMVKFLMYPSVEDSLKLNELMELCTNLQKKGRKILDIDVDEDITLYSTHVDTDPDMFRVHDLHGDEVFVEIKEPMLNATITISTIPISVASATTTTVDELTLAQTLIEIKAAKPKVRGVMIQEPSEITTTTPDASKPLQDKGKAKMIESKEPLKMKPKDQKIKSSLMNKKL